MSNYTIKDELNVIEPKKISIYKDDFHNLRLIIKDDKEYPEVEAVMGFPLTDPGSFISLIEMNDGKKEKEIGVIENINKLDSKSKKILKEQLKKTYFMPKITKINQLKENHGIMQFDVETDKGNKEFETQHKEDIRKLPGGHIIIKDGDGNRYEIKDYRKLDKRSINLIDSEI